MKRSHSKQLTPLINQLIRNIRSTSSTFDLRELLRIIHRPGWTSIAEVAFVKGILTATNAHLQVITTLRGALLAGSRRVERS